MGSGPGNPPTVSDMPNGVADSLDTSPGTDANGTILT